MKIIGFIVLTIFTLNITKIQAQNIKLSIEEAFELALKNSQKLKISRISEELAEQKVEIAELSRLPSVSAGLNYGYISNSQIWTPGFGEHKTSEIPHHLTQFSIQASQIIFKGGEINNTLAKVNLENQISVLNHNKNIVDIKFLVAAKYLDIFQLQNQLKIITENIKLAMERLKNIRSLFRQGIVTNNDVLRTELQISDLDIAKRKISNDVVIINQQFNTLLGLEETIRLDPDETLIAKEYQYSAIESELMDALANNQDIAISSKEISVAKRNLKIIGADRYPEIALFASNNFQRPYLNALPALDIYSNVWQAGITIRYNISSIYQSGRKIKAGKIQLSQVEEREVLLRQNLELEMREAYIKYGEALTNLKSYQSNIKSADENYRIVEKKYFNQLALLTDMIDASNTKLDAEIKMSNANITVLYTYYKLLRIKGTL